ncbi:uncharacterized protein EKO05_0005414 [Ascochyta rabiei]|uniref:Uncharacterized protein n=1 Tax=Didymella rabiei TaxID=5454 RepID=A0A163JSH8_DIDRA|nr:uncharacterized protein EKO05_0005414 [Ascochyta rabiei]KZM26564.1 hypothetical protein ST47_g2273 [Ascochyta rabiei]UPX14944.1 hypothetical protein EKO05_0005414 [Ascochyta rabiei]
MLVSSVLAFAALASATPFGVVTERDIFPAYPLTQILPVPGYNSTTDGFNRLGNLYTNSAAQLTAQANEIAQKTIALNGSGGVTYNYDVKASLASSLTILNNLLWQTAYQTEQRVCAIVTSINQQNVDTVNGNLRAGIAAEVQAIIRITVTLTTTIATIKAQLAAFSEAERVVVATLIQAIATAASASLGPAAQLSGGLSAAGLTGLADVVGGLQVAITSLQALATINWSF